MGKHKSRFLIKQRAFLKIYLIYMAEKERLYGLKYLETIREEFKNFGYKPNHSEIYKSLHELLQDGVLKRIKRVKEGINPQEVVYYVIADQEKANLYKKQLKVELDRCYNMLGKAIADIYR
jgi:DNA-binding PadR family transcriptional regulator